MRKFSRNINCEKVQTFREKNNAKISPKNNIKTNRNLKIASEIKFSSSNIYESKGREIIYMTK